MADEDLSSLVDFGLTRLQARVYLTLVRLGISRASRLSSTVGIIRPETYRILRELCGKGIVQRNLGSPSTYIAIPPGKALSLLTKQLRERLINLDKKRLVVAKSLSSMLPETSETNPGLSLITGGDKLIVKLKEMMIRAKDDYAGIHSKYGLRRWMDDELARTLVQSARRKKLQVRMIAEVDETSVRTANYLSQYVEIRQSKNLLFYLDIFDAKEMVFGPAFPLTEQEAKEMEKRELDLWTSNPSFIRGMYTMFDRLWEVCPKYVPR